MRSAIRAIRNAAQMLSTDAETPAVAELADLLTRAADVAERIDAGERDRRFQVALANAVACLTMADAVPARRSDAKEFTRRG